MGKIKQYFQSLAHLVNFGQRYDHLEIAILASKGVYLGKMVDFEMAIKVAQEWSRGNLV